MHPHFAVKPPFLVALSASGLLVAALWLAPAVRAGGPATVSLEVVPGSVLPGEVAEVEIWVETQPPLGAYSVEIDCDPTLFAIESVRGGVTDEFAGSPFSNVSGCNARLSGFQAVSLDSPTGLVSVARFDLRAAADAVPTPDSLIDLTVRSLNDTDSVAIPAVAIDGSLSVTSLCGNGAPDAGEQCDDGDAEWSVGEWCNAQCVMVDCGDPNDSGVVSATDALFALRTSVALETCAPCVCDVDDSGGAIAVTDALLLLRISAAVDGDAVCPVCF